MGSRDYLQSSRFLYSYPSMTSAEGQPIRADFFNCPTGILAIYSRLLLSLGLLTSLSCDPVHDEFENMTGETIMQTPLKICLVKPSLSNRARFTYSKCMCRKISFNKMVLRRSRSLGTDQYGIEQALIAAEIGTNWPYPASLERCGSLMRTSKASSHRLSFEVPIN